MQLSIFDAHCDTIQKICDFGGNLLENDYQVDLLRLRKNLQKRVHIFAAFIDKKTDLLPPKKRAIQLIDTYYREIDKFGQYIAHCNNTDEIYKALDESKVASMLSIEGGEALQGEIKALDMFYSLGVRIVTLCWNYKNEIGDGICEDCGRGLTDFGKEVVKRMNSLGMLIDVSHLSDTAFWQVCEYSEKPIAATHSNSRVKMDHPRNLTDEQIKAIIEKDGCIGINLYTDFLAEGECGIKDVIGHIEHILALGGENNIGFGCDFDGMDSLPKGIQGTQDLHLVINELIRLGYSKDLVKKIGFENFLRVIGQTIG